MELNSENTSNIFRKCLFGDEEDKEGAVFADGVMSKIGFHPGRLKSEEGNIMDLLAGLPDEFKEGKGGGWTFLNACQTKNGGQWGEHSNIDQLICLGLAIGKVEFLMPRDMWKAFPSGMPYFVVKN